jgi:aspartate racemase
MRLYQNRLARRGYDCVVPTEAEMVALVSPGIEAVKANRLAAGYPPLAEAARNLAARGARAVVLGCTEVPLAIAAGPALPLPVADTLDSLARAAIRWAGRAVA